MKCSSCRTDLEIGYVGPCPTCGSMDRDIAVEDDAKLDDRVSSWTKTRTYWENRPLLLGFLAVVALGSPFLGLVLVGWPGVMVGLAVSVLSFIGGFFAATRVREIESGGA